MLWFLRIRERLREVPRANPADTLEPPPSPAVLVAERRLSFMLRSVAQLLFAIGFFWPTLSYPMLVRLFAAYVFVDGVVALAPGGIGFRSRRVWPLLAGGAVSIATAILTYGWPGLSFPMLVTATAVWAIATGVCYAASCVSLRRGDPDHLLLLGSIASFLFGRALLSHRAADLVVLSTWMGLYALTIGIITLNLSVKQYRLSW